MSTRRIEANLTIRAVDQYSSVLRNMRNVTGRFAENVRSQMGGLQRMRGPLRMIEDFRRQQSVVRQSGEAMARARERVRQLQQAIRTTRNPTSQMRREFERARSAADRLEQSHRRNRAALNGLHGQLREAGVNTADLTGEQRRLAGSLDTATASFGTQMQRMQRFERMQTRIAEGRERMNRSLATAANLRFSGQASIETGRRIINAMSGPVQRAIEFESAMADVRKVVDFESPEAFAQMSEDIQQLSTRIPIAAEGLAQIVAAGGQAGIPYGELLEFASSAARVGVAFDITADQAGSAMAGIRTQLSLGAEDTGLLFDAMNQLSNAFRSEAPQLLQFSGAGLLAQADAYGFAANEALAFGAAMIAADAPPQVAATSFRNMGRALTRGASATDRQRESMARLGLEAEDVARRMQEDAAGTTIDVLERIAGLSDDLRPALISDLFGDEARALAPLLRDVNLLREALGLVAESQSYSGSVEREYGIRSEATAYQIQLVRSSLDRLGNSIGEVVLPVLNKLLKRSQAIIERFVEWTRAHPKLTKWLVIGAGAIGAMAVAGGVLLTAAAGLVGTFAVLRFGMVGFGARAAFAAGELGGLGGTFRGLSRLPFPNLAGATARFASFAADSTRHLVGLSETVESRSAMIERRLARLRMMTISAGIMTYLNLARAPSDVETEEGRAEIAEFQDNNVRALDSTLRRAPFIGRLTELYERSFEYIHGRSAPVPDAVVSEDPQTRAAARTVERYANAEGLPTLERLQALRGFAIDLREEVAGIRSEIGAMDVPDSPYDGPPDYQAAQSRLRARLRELELVEQQLASDEVAAAELGSALQVLSETEVTPEISTESIERALRRVQQLATEMRNLRSAGVGDTRRLPESPRTAGARAFGGPIRAGLPYLVNENTPRSEIIVPSLSGGVLNVPQAQAVFRRHLGSFGSSAMLRPPSIVAAQAGAQRLRAASLAALTASLVSTPVAAQTPSQPARLGDTRVEIGSISVNVPSGVTDPQAIVDLITQQLGDRVRDLATASFSD